MHPRLFAGRDLGLHGEQCDDAATQEPQLESLTRDGWRTASLIDVRSRLLIGQLRPRRARVVGSAPSRMARRPADHIGGNRRADDPNQAQHVLEHMRQTIRLPRDRHADRRHQADPPHRTGIHQGSNSCDQG